MCFAVGVIFTNRSVVYNRDSPTVNLVVMATDHGDVPRTAVVPVQIHVVDINNNHPVFSAEVYK